MLPCLMSRLRSIEEIPQPFTQIFQAYPSFNLIQSVVLDDILYKSQSVVITAPTGSGKTVLFELAIVSILMGLTERQTFKAVYIAPVKALCNERCNDWSSRFGPIGVSCIEVTGDNLDDPSLDNYQIILTTPEKWDSLSRRWRDKISVFLSVKLMMIDEVHLIRDEKRGPVLESIVCRMKTMMRVLKNEGSVRFIAVSATIFNIEDLAVWLGSRDKPAVCHRFGNECRPVALKRIVKGYPQAKGQSEFLYDIQLSYKLKPILLEHAQGKPVLIFCSTRRGVIQTCKILLGQISFHFSTEDRNTLFQASSRIIDNKLRESVPSGIAYHHAGMVKSDRQIIQDLFMQSSLPVLVATSTLAMGVNLPAHLVIIKSTHQYIAGRVEEYPDSTVLQMIGRAGRPQYDTSATAVILTKPSRVRHFENLLDSKEVLESSLLHHLAEHLNSEIVLLTIGDLGVAMEWLRCTFLYQRALKNPQFYGLGSIDGNIGRIEKALEAVILREINALKRDGLVEMNENGLDVSPTANGRLMSHFYVNFLTFRLFSDITSMTTIKDLIQLLSNSNEFSEIQLRVSERRILNELNICKQKETIRFPMKGKINTRSLKVNCLVQACLGCLTIPDPSLFQEALRAVNILERVVKCLVQYLKLKHWYIAYLSAVIFAKCLHARLWENSTFVARQLEKIGPALCSILVECGKISFDSLEMSHPQELERILNRPAPFGTVLLDQVRHLPRYILKVEVIPDKLSKILKISVVIANKLLVSGHNTAGMFHTITIIVGDSDNRLLHSRQVPDSTILRESLMFAVTLHRPLPQQVYINVISNQWVGIDVSQSVSMNPLAGCIVDGNSHIFSCLRNAEEKEITTKGSNNALNSCRGSKSLRWERLDNKSLTTNAPEDLVSERPKIIVECPASSGTDYPGLLSPNSYRRTVEENLNPCFDVEPTFLEESANSRSIGNANFGDFHKVVKRTDGAVWTVMQIDGNDKSSEDSGSCAPSNLQQQHCSVERFACENVNERSIMPVTEHNAVAIDSSPNPFLLTNSSEVLGGFRTLISSSFGIGSSVKERKGLLSSSSLHHNYSLKNRESCTTENSNAPFQSLARNVFSNDCLSVPFSVAQSNQGLSSDRSQNSSSVRKVSFGNCPVSAKTMEEPVSKVLKINRDISSLEVKKCQTPLNYSEQQQTFTSENTNASSPPLSKGNQLTLEGLPTSFSLVHSNPIELIDSAVGKDNFANCLVPAETTEEPISEVLQLGDTKRSLAAVSDLAIFKYPQECCFKEPRLFHAEGVKCVSPFPALSKPAEISHKTGLKVLQINRVQSLKEDTKGYVPLNSPQLYSSGDQHSLSSEIINHSLPSINDVPAKRTQETEDTVSQVLHGANIFSPTISSKDQQSEIVNASSPFQTHVPEKRTEENRDIVSEVLKIGDTNISVKDTTGFAPLNFSYQYCYRGQQPFTVENCNSQCPSRNGSVPEDPVPEVLQMDGTSSSKEEKIGFFSLSSTSQYSKDQQQFTPDNTNSQSLSQPSYIPAKTSEGPGFKVCQIGGTLSATEDEKRFISLYSLHQYCSKDQQATHENSKAPFLPEQNPFAIANSRSSLLLSGLSETEDSKTKSLNSEFCPEIFYNLWDKEKKDSVAQEIASSDVILSENMEVPDLADEMLIFSKTETYSAPTMRPIKCISREVEASSSVHDEPELHATEPNLNFTTGNDDRRDFVFQPNLPGVAKIHSSQSSLVDGPSLDFWKITRQENESFHLKTSPTYFKLRPQEATNYAQVGVRNLNESQGFLSSALKTTTDNSNTCLPKNYPFLDPTPKPKGQCYGNSSTNSKLPDNADVPRPKALLPLNNNHFREEIAEPSCQISNREVFSDNILSYNRYGVLNQSNDDRYFNDCGRTVSPENVAGQPSDDSSLIDGDPSCENSNSFYFDQPPSPFYLSSTCMDVQDDSENIKPRIRSMKEIVEMARIAKLKAKLENN